MKATLYTLVFVLGLGGLLKAQDYGQDSAKCRENLYIYYELAKKKQYLEAYDSWQIVYDMCPGSSKNNFIYGTPIVKAKIKAAKEAGDAETETKFKNLLMELYDKRNEIYPGKEGYVASRKAIDFFTYFKGEDQKAYDLFTEALKIGGQKQSAAFYDRYFNVAARLFKAKTFGVEDVFEAYNLVLEGIEFNNNSLNVIIAELEVKRDSNGTALTDKEQKEYDKAKRELDRYTKVASNVVKILAPILTCERLVILYNEETFEANKNDTLWLVRAAKILQKERRNEETGEMEDCTDNPIFFNVSDALYRMKPSAPSARAMFILAYRDGQYDAATNYVKEAIGFEVDPVKRAKDYMKLAQVYLKRGSLSGAKTAAMNAARSDKGSGDPYVLIAQIYAAAAGSCGNNVFEKNAVYWAAVDKLNYAKSVDPAVANKANRLIASYKKNYPDKGVSFQLGHVEGEKYTIGCWINETITVSY